ncbi:MAG: PD-(D/E)XK nuclease family protein, partial [Gammaproteobacteria bacterium]
EFLYTALRAAGGPAGIGDDELEATIDAAIGRALDKNIPRGHPLEDTLRANERRRQQHILAGLVDLDRGREGLEIVDLEGQHEIAVGGLTLNVRFDRVDRVDGERLVIDYKTGAHFSISRCRGERPLQLQLPLYAAYSSAAGIGLCWLHAERVRIDAIAMRDFGLRFTGHARKRLLSEADWAALIADWRGVIETLAAEFSAGDARIDLEQERYATGQFAMLTRRWDIGHVLRAEELE